MVCSDRPRLSAPHRRQLELPRQIIENPSINLFLHFIITPSYLVQSTTRRKLYTMADIDLQAVHDELVSVAYEAGAMILAANPAELDTDTKLNCTIMFCP
jgi:hypothetical protein